MIVEYHRPKDKNEALELIGRSNPPTLPLGGGTLLARPSNEEFAVVDLQDLGLNQINTSQNSLSIGATVTLQSLLDFLLDLELEVFKGKFNLEKAIQHEAAFNLRQVASIGGTIVSAGGRSPFVTSLLALDAVLKVIKTGGEVEKINLGDMFPLWNKSSKGRLRNQNLTSGLCSLPYPINNLSSHHPCWKSLSRLKTMAIQSGW